VWDQPPRSWSGRGDDPARKPDGTLPTYLPWAILCTVLFFAVGGVVAIVYGLLVNRRVAAGDWEGASRASGLARRWCLISVAVGAFVLLLLAFGVVKHPHTSL
jgi:hypothetical protein